MQAFALKKLALPGIALASVVGFSQSAPAYSPFGSVLVGPATINIFMFGRPFVCSATFTVKVYSGGAAEVVNVVFNTPGESFCPSSIGSGFPWPISAATQVSVGVYQQTINGVVLTIRQPPNNTIVFSCSGSINVTIDQGFFPHRFKFWGSLTSTVPLVGQPCNVSKPPNTYLPTVLTAP